MSRAWISRTVWGALAGILAPVTAGAPGWAQGLPNPTGPGTLPPASPTPDGGAPGGPLMAVILIVAVLALLTALVKLTDLARARANEALHVQAQISEALLREPSLYSLPITSTARVPLWRGAPVTVEVAGHVPTSDARQAVLRIVEHETSRVRSDFRIDDRLQVTPATTTRAA